MMESRFRGPTVVAALTGLGLLAGAGAAAQGRCTMDQLAGTYAFESHGSSTFVLATAPPRHWSLTSAPLVLVGWLTLGADGAAHGEGWVILGRVSSGLTAQPFAGGLTAFEGSTCTAVLEWSGSPVPGGPPGLHRERLVFVDNGRGFRSLLIQSPSATMAWIGRGSRITHAPDAVSTCGPHLLRGDLLLHCESVSSVVDPTGQKPASAAWLFALRVERDGSSSGVSYSKDPVYFEREVEGAFEVGSNCMVEARLESAPSSLPAFAHRGRGMIFDEGKAGFMIMPFETTQPDGSVLPAVLSRCELLSLGR